MRLSGAFNSRLFMVIDLFFFAAAGVRESFVLPALPISQASLEVAD